MRARVLLFAIVLGIIPFVGLTETSTAAAKPNVFFYNLDDLRDAVPGVAGNVDPVHAEGTPVDVHRHPL